MGAWQSVLGTTADLQRQASLRNQVMYQPHANVQTPPGETIIWRYLSMEKLVALLASQSLAFVRLDQFRDPWEGWLPRGFYDEFAEDFPTEVRENVMQVFHGHRLNRYVNCWHQNDQESAALWDQYSMEGFAIRSTIDRLQRSLKSDREVYIGAVEYRDYTAQAPKNAFKGLRETLTKRKSFEHEREVRAIVMTDGELRIKLHQAGTTLEEMKLQLPLVELIPVELDIVIESLFISPIAPQWMVPHVEALLQAFGLSSTPVQHSELYAPYVL